MRTLFTCFIILFVFAGKAQNLVPNHSFEEYWKCPKDVSDCGQVKYWYQPTQGTTDYFNKCGKKGKAGVPINAVGYQLPQDGNGYIGMVFYQDNPGSGDYREYFSCKLLSTLIKGKQYAVRFYVSLAESSRYAASNIEVLFSSDSVFYPSTEKLQYKPQLTYSSHKLVTDMTNWTEIQWTYIASGNESYITIGNFTPREQCKVSRVGENITSYSYYYVDNVCISEIKENGTCDCGKITRIDTAKKIVKKPDSLASINKHLIIESNKPIILTNISFESDKSELLPSSFNELDQLVDYLQKHKTVKIEINGFTDNTGDEIRNLKLSEERAKAVADYLESKNIDKTRIKHKGYGSANPVADNSSEEGKVKNRRVEFKIIK